MTIRLRSTLMAFLVTVLCVGVVQAAEAYEEVQVTNGGTLIGTVTLIGDVPRPMGYNLARFPHKVYCGRISNGAGWRLLQPFNIGAKGAFRDVVVMLEEVAKGKPIRYQTPRVEAIDCTFKPFISVVWNKKPIEVVNMDPVFHDVQAYETSRFGPQVLFNGSLLMYPRNTKETVTKPGNQEHRAGEAMVQHIDMQKGRRVFVMQCGFHAYMESWGLVMDHPYYALTDQEGHFKIGDIPPGRYKVVVWHPLILEGSGKEYQVTIRSKETTTLEANINSPTGRLYANQMEVNPGFDQGMTGGTHIVPSVEKQKF